MSSEICIRLLNDPLLSSVPRRPPTSPSSSHFHCLHVCKVLTKEVSLPHVYL